METPPGFQAPVLGLSRIALGLLFARHGAATLLDVLGGPHGRWSLARPPALAAQLGNRDRREVNTRSQTRAASGRANAMYIATVRATRTSGPAGPGRRLRAARPVCGR